MFGEASECVPTSVVFSSAQVTRSHDHTDKRKRALTMGLVVSLNRFLASITGGLNVDILTSYIEPVNIIRLYCFVFFLCYPLGLSWDIPYAAAFNTTSYEIIQNDSSWALISSVVGVTGLFTLLKLSHYIMRRLIRWADPDFNIRKKKKKDKLRRASKKSKAIPMEQEMSSLSPGLGDSQT